MHNTTHTQINNSNYNYFLREVMEPENFRWLNFELKMEGSTPHQWSINGETLTFQGMIRFMEDYRNGVVNEISSNEEVILVALYVFFRMEGRFEQLSSTEVTWDKIEHLVDESVVLFAEHLPDVKVEELLNISMPEKVKRIPLLRSQVKEKLALYNTIDGNSMQWWENVYDPKHLKKNDIPLRLQVKIEQATSTNILTQDDYVSYFTAVADHYLENRKNVLELLELITKDLIEDEQIGGADCSILVGPREILVDRPWEMATDDYLFTVVYMNQLYDPQMHDLKANLKQVQNMVITRMFVDKIRKAHYYNPDEMVRYNKSVAHLAVPDRSISQHVHQKGHAAAGVRATLRAPIAFRVPNSDRLFTGFSDVRLFRSNNSDDFSQEALYRTIVYASWIKVIMERSFEKGVPIKMEGHDPTCTFFTREGNKRR